MKFKDLMAKVPTCVGVIIVDLESGFDLCTISSFVSVSVEEGREIAIFTLKNSSRTGTSLKTRKEFTISILKLPQEEIAKVAGGNFEKSLKNEKIAPYIGINSEGVSFILNSYLVFELSYMKSIKIEDAEIYICKINAGVIPEEELIHQPLVYHNRKFTTIEFR